MSTVLRTSWWVLLFALGALQQANAQTSPAAASPAAPALQTRNVVLIVSDGLRWQEIFTGADPTLLNEKYGGIWEDEAQLRREFWRADVNERRKALFPFLWTTVATHGQIFGNRFKDSKARVTNGLRVFLSRIQRDADRPPRSRASTPTISVPIPTSRCSNG